MFQIEMFALLITNYIKTCILLNYSNSRFNFFLLLKNCELDHDLFF